MDTRATGREVRRVSRVRVRVRSIDRQVATCTGGEFEFFLTTRAIGPSHVSRFMTRLAGTGGGGVSHS